MTPAQRRRRARAVHVPCANTADRVGVARAAAAAGTKAFLDRFERQVDPERALPAEVRAATAQHAHAPVGRALRRRPVPPSPTRPAATHSLIACSQEA
jgi:hypothetical protein